MTLAPRRFASLKVTSTSATWKVIWVVPAPPGCSRGFTASTGPSVRNSTLRSVLVVTVRPRT